MEGESPTLAEHFRRGNPGPTPPVYQLVGEEEGGSLTLAEHYRRRNLGPTLPAYQLVGEKEGQSGSGRTLPNGKPRAYATSVSAGRRGGGGQPDSG